MTITATTGYIREGQNRAEKGFTRLERVFKAHTPNEQGAATFKKIKEAVVEGIDAESYDRQADE